MNNRIKSGLEVTVKCKGGEQEGSSGKGFIQQVPRTRYARAYTTGESFGRFENEPNGGSKVNLKRKILPKCGRICMLR